MADARGSSLSMVKITQGHIKSWLVAVLPIYEQRAISDFLDRELERTDLSIDKVNQAINYLKEYRTALISAAVTGKIDVREEVA